MTKYLSSIQEFFVGLSVFYKAVFLALVIWAAVFSILAGTIGVFLYMVILTALVMVLLRKEQKLTGYFALAFLVISLCSVVIYYAQTAVSGTYLMFKDDVYYVRHIDELVRNYRPEYLVTNNDILEKYRFITVRIPQTGFIYLVGTLTKVFCGQPNPLFYLATTASMAALIVLMTAKLAQAATGSEKIVRISVIIALVYPHFLLYSGVLLKDILSVLLIVCIAYNIITIQKGTAWKALAIVLLLAYYLFVRYRVGIVLISLSIFMFIWPKNEALTLRAIGKSVISRWWVVLIFIVISALLYLYCYKGATEISAAMVGEIPFEMDGSQAGALKYLQQEIANSVGPIGFLEAIYLIPPVLRQIFVFFFILLSPFNFYSVFSGASEKIVWSIFMDLGTLFWLVCLPLFVVGLYVTIRKKYNNQVLYYIVMLVAVMAVVMYVHIRWKLMVWPFIAVVIATGMEHWRQHRKMTAISAIGTIVVACAYLALKIIL